MQIERFIILVFIIIFILIYEIIILFVHISSNKINNFVEFELF